MLTVFLYCYCSVFSAHSITDSTLLESYEMNECDTPELFLFSCDFDSNRELEKKEDDVSKGHTEVYSIQGINGFGGNAAMYMRS